MSKPDAVTATYQTKTSSLDKIQEHLLHGERKKAYQLALDERLWAHALLIARGLDEESWTEAAHEFIKIELSSQGVGYDPQQPFSSDGRESLRVAYGLFAGDGPSALKLLVPPARFGVNSLQSHSRVSSSHASISPDAPTTEATSVPEETWAQWRKLLAATIANQSPNNTAATTALGDYLLANNWVEAAHCCYLLALSTSPFSGASAPGVRIVLLGAANPLFSSSFRTDVQTILISEVAEFAMSLLPTGKGAESFHGSPHLQAYRLWHAICLAEMGDITLATRYTDAINATIKSATRGSPFFTHTFFQQLEYLQDRLVEAPHAEKAKAWLSKPSVRSFNDWFTGGLEKLIQGDETPHNEESSQSKKSLEIASNIGPFSHYSSISSATPSAIPSPSPSFTNLHSASASIGRAESAAGHRPPATHHSTLPLPPPPPRAASAVDFSKTKPPPAPKPSSAGAAITSFPNRYQPPPNQTPPTSAGLDAGDAPRPLYAQWWSDSNDNDGVTPTATTFRSPGADGDTGSFVSLMDSEPTLMPSASYGSTASVNRQTDFDEDEEDLGFGNSKKPKKSESSGDTPEDQSKQSPNQSSSDTKATTTDNKTELAAAAAPAKGWFGWLRRGEATPKPIVAKLGEESAFYFDKDLGKWVNKKAGAEPAAPKAPPPPPSRSQTVSPSRGGAGINTATPPPPRAASVAQMHVSGLAPPSRPSSALSSTSNESPGSFSDSAPPSRASPAPPPRSFGQTPPPPTGSPAGSVSGRPTKKNARSRYVDVFQTS
ncbi:hypothetical protein FRC14_006698 [Serendipita sp. 396]|nr:hypothetical protein FRC14_006698 [Serendipita sp. 396]